MTNKDQRGEHVYYDCTIYGDKRIFVGPDGIIFANLGWNNIVTSYFFIDDTKSKGDEDGVCKQKSDNIIF